MKVRSRAKGEGAVARRQSDQDLPLLGADGGKPRRGTKHPNPTNSVLKVCTGCALSVLLLTLISGVEFQGDEHEAATSSNIAGLQSQTKQRIAQEITPKSPPALDRQAQPDGSVCRYDGHCGVSETCAVAPGAVGGTCEPFSSKGRENSVTEQACFDTCLKELQLDEHWYQEQWPVVEWSENVVSEGRPDGCLIVYHREPQGNQLEYLDVQDRKGWHEVPPSIVEEPPSLIDWVNNRFHHIKRVDPLNSSDLADTRWMALCTPPCKSDVDCATKNDGPIPGFVCRERACLRNPQFWGPESPTKETPHKDMEAAADMVLVTGATDGYLSGLTNLAASARYWAPQYKMVVYNLGGMTAEHIKMIRSWSNVIAVEWENGVPDKYPEHVKVGQIYAWKPIIVNETVHKYKSIFWLDSGSTLAGPVQPVQEALQHQGIMLMKGQDMDMRPMAYEKTFEWFGYNKATMAVGPHFSGNTQAFMFPSRYIDMVVIPNCKCALDEDCITPPGSSLSNHRYDQTTISIAAYAPKTRLPHYTEFLAAASNQLKSDLKEPSFKFVWTARQGCDFYAKHDPELRGEPPDGGYFNYVPKRIPTAISGDGGDNKGSSTVGESVEGISNILLQRMHLFHGPGSLEGGDEIPDPHEHHLIRRKRAHVRQHRATGGVQDQAIDHKEEAGGDQHVPRTSAEEERKLANERLQLARLKQARLERGLDW